VGVIKVRVCWRSPGSQCKPPNVPRSLKNGTVHERTKKMASHRIALGEITPLSVDDHWYRDPRVPQYNEIEFHFYYADKDLLMARDIMPIFVPDNAGGKRSRETGDDDDFTAEDEAELLRLQEKLSRRDMKRVKKEHEVKEENGPIDLTALEVPKHIVIIDLTED